MADKIGKKGGLLLAISLRSLRSQNIILSLVRTGFNYLLVL